MIDKNAWKEAFQIVSVTDRHPHHLDPMWFTESERWELRDHAGNRCGSYRDPRYAVKQARRKYRKLIKKLEKTLTS